MVECIYKVRKSFYMPRKLTIKDIREEALSKYNLSLLSTEYKNAMSKLTWLDNNTGVVFSREWHSIKSGHLLPVNPNRKLTIPEIKKIALSKYNITLVSDKYVNNYTKLEWVDNDTRTKFYRSWNDIVSGHLSPINNNDYENDKSKIESYKGLGYKYNQTKEQYLSARRNGSRIFIIEHPLLAEPWVTTMHGFLRGAETYLSHSGMSYGESSIYSILSYNGISFKTQYSVTINNHNHKFDFFLPEYNLFIEYDGAQHYHPVKPWGGNSAFVERAKRDNEKDTYVDSIGAKMLRIPYTVATSRGILEKLSEYLGSLVFPTGSDCMDLAKEVASYYSSHTSKETTDKFNLSKNTVTKYYKQTYGVLKNKRKAEM